MYQERFAKAHGPLRSVVERVLRGFMRCGLVEHGFARLWCGTCRTSVLCPFSCRGRSFCPSCEKKKQLLWAEWLQKKVLEPVPHRSCRPHHAAPPPRNLPQAPRASSRPRAVPGGGRRRVHVGPNVAPSSRPALGNILEPTANAVRSPLTPTFRFILRVMRRPASAGPGARHRGRLSAAGRTPSRPPGRAAPRRTCPASSGRSSGCRGGPRSWCGRCPGRAPSGSSPRRDRTVPGGSG